MRGPEDSDSGSGSDLTVRHVTAGYATRAVLNDVSVVARAGEITGLIGPNGSGKTTLIRVASRGLRPRSGRVSIGEVDPYSLPAREAARLVGVVPQEVAPVFAFSVLELVMMGRAPHRSGRPRRCSISPTARFPSSLEVNASE